MALVIRIDAPSNNAQTTGKNITVDFSSHQTVPSGAEPPSFLIYFVASTITLTGPGGSRSQQVSGSTSPLPEGANLNRSVTFRNVPVSNPRSTEVLTIRLEDDNNRQDDTHTVRHIVDDTRPTVRIDTPSADAPAASGRLPIAGATGSISIAGVASDNYDISRVEYRVANDAGWTNASGTRNWSATLRPLPLETHTLRVRARDEHGNLSTEAVRTFELFDAGAPAVEVGSPSLGVEHVVPLIDGSAAAYVLGTATDPSGIDWVRYRVDGGPDRNATVGPVTGNTTPFSITETLTTARSPHHRRAGPRYGRQRVGRASGPIPGRRADHAARVVVSGLPPPTCSPTPRTGWSGLRVPTSTPRP